MGTWQGRAARAGSHPAPSLANSSGWALGRAELGMWKPKADPADPLRPPGEVLAPALPLLLLVLAHPQRS